MLSEWVVLRVVGFAHCYALHFNQPPRSAYWCMDYHVGMSREAFGKQLTDYSIVGSVAQIDHHHAYVLHGAVGFSQQRFYILPHAVGLTANVLGIDNLPLVVDTGSARYKHLSAVAIIDHGASLKAHTILAGAVQVGRSIEICHLLFLNTSHGIGVQLCQHVRVCLSATNAGRGYEVGLGSKSLGEEELVSRTHHTAIVQIHIVDKKPSAYAVVFQRASFINELQVVFVEKQASLIFRVGCHVVGTAAPKVTVSTVAHLIEATLTYSGLYVGHQINPQCHLGAVERSLLDDTFGTIGHIWQPLHLPDWQSRLGNSA